MGLDGRGGIGQLEVGMRAGVAEFGTDGRGEDRPGQVYIYGTAARWVKQESVRVRDTTPRLGWAGLAPPRSGSGSGRNSIGSVWLLGLLASGCSTLDVSP